MAADPPSPAGAPTRVAMAEPASGPGRAANKEVDLDFWLYKYKVVSCPRRDPHDWEKCVYAHRGEKARRRHPSKYQAVQCPEARAKKVCPRGEDCPCTHHLFEYWLHPDRFRTCLCEHGSNCQRSICFFAHCAEEMRPLPSGQTLAADMPPRKPKGPHAAGSSTPPSPTLSDYSLDPNLFSDPYSALLFDVNSLGTSPRGGLGQQLLVAGGGPGEEALLQMPGPIRTVQPGTSPPGSGLSSEVSPGLSPRLAGMVAYPGAHGAPGYRGSVSPGGYSPTLSNGAGGVAGAMVGSPGSYLSPEALQMGLMQLQLQGSAMRSATSSPGDVLMQQAHSPGSPSPQAGPGAAQAAGLVGPGGPIGTGFAVMDTQAVVSPDLEPGTDLLSFSLWDLEGRPTAAALSGQFGNLAGMDIGALQQQAGMANLLLQQQQQQQQQQMAAAAMLQQQQQQQQQQRMAAAAAAATRGAAVSQAPNQQRSASGRDFQGFESWASPAGQASPPATGTTTPTRLSGSVLDANGSRSITRTSSGVSVTSTGQPLSGPPGLEGPSSVPDAVDRLLQQVTALKAAGAAPGPQHLPAGGVVALADDLSRLLSTHDQERLLVELSKRLALAGSNTGAAAEPAARSPPATTGMSTHEAQ